MSDAPFCEVAPAKINLALHVRGRMADGYHALETLFAFTAFGDRVEAAPATDWALEVVGGSAHALGPADENLVLRAARAFRETTATPARYRLRLHKHIPVAAGLGGGSADAAATLRLLNRLAGHPLDQAGLLAIAAALGADVPACLVSRTMFGRGRGDQLLPVSGPGGVPVLLVNPRCPLATAAVFAGWDGVDHGPLDPANWRHGRNDLTASATALQPVIAEVLDWLRRLPGASHVRMSGSGATCLALFEGAAVPAMSPPDGWWNVSTVLL